MTIIAQYLFGSHARRDFSAHSDVDLLSITDGHLFSSRNVGVLNISFYPKTQCLKAANEGDLFILHIILEATCLHDSGNFDKALKSSFNYKSTYQNDVSNAVDLGWFVLENATVYPDPAILNKRIAWCVRTVLIAKSAERRVPIFSASRLAAESDFLPTLRLINRKSESDLDLLALEQFRQFLIKVGLRSFPSFRPSDWKAAWWHFVETNNKFGLRVLKDLNVQDTDYVSGELGMY